MQNSGLSRKAQNPEKPGKQGIIPGLPCFFAHRGKPGKRGPFFPDFPGFSRLLGCRIPGFPGNHRILESQESGNHSRIYWKVWKTNTLLAFLESQESPGFPGKPRDSRLSWLFLMWKKARKVRKFSVEFRGILGSFLQG